MCVCGLALSEENKNNHSAYIFLNIEDIRKVIIQSDNCTRMHANESKMSVNAVAGIFSPGCSESIPIGRIAKVFQPEILVISAAAHGILKRDNNSIVI